MLLARIMRELEFTPLEFETAARRQGIFKERIRIYSVGV